MSKFRVGDDVLWFDPDEDISSGQYTVKEIKGEIIVIENLEGSQAEAFENELEFASP